MTCKTRLLALVVLVSVLWPVAPVAAEELRVVLRNASVFVGEGEGEPEGFDVDLLNMFVKWHGNRTGEGLTYDATVVETVPELLARVRGNRCDLAIGSITITAERDETVDFSTAYLPLRAALIARPGTFATGDLAPPLEEKLAGRRLGVERGTTHESFGTELAARLPELELDASFATLPDLLEALTQSEPTVDAAITDITHYWITSQTMELELVETVGPAQGLGFVLPEGSPLKASLDEFLTELRHSHTYFSLVERYFGNEAAKMVRTSRAEP